MIDTRLTALHPHRVNRLSLIHQAQTAAAEPWFGRAAAIVAVWFEHTMQSIDAKEMSVSDATETIVNAPRNALPLSQLAAEAELPLGFTDAFEGVVSGQIPMTTEGAALAAGWVWGSGLAAACESQKWNLFSLRVAWRLAYHVDIALNAFLDGLTAQVEANSKELLAALANLVEEIAGDPGKFVMGRRGIDFEEHVERWRRSTDLSAMWWWPYNHFVPFRSEELGILICVFRGRPEMFVGFLEELAIPDAIDQLFAWPEISDDFSSIIGLLWVAPDSRILDAEETVRWNGKKTPSGLIGLALSHIERIINALGENERAALLETEARSMVTTLTDVTVARPDGLFLLSQWGEELVRRGRGMPAWKTKSTPLLDLALDTVAKALASRVTAMSEIYPLLRYSTAATAPDHDEALSAESPGDSIWPASGMNSLLLCMLVNEELATTAQQNHILHGALRQCLMVEASRFAMSGQATTPGWWHWTPALLYVKTSCPIKTWLSDWHALSERRRRAAHWQYTNEGQLDYEASKYLSIVGIAVVDWLMSGEHLNEAVAQDMWTNVLESLLPLVIASNDLLNTWHDIVVLLFARLPHLARALGDGERAAASRVTSSLSIIGADDDLFFRCAATAVANGIASDNLIATCREAGMGDIRLRAQQFADWRGRGRNAQVALQQLTPFLTQATGID